MELHIKNLCKSFDGRPVLENVSFTAGPGVTCVMAPSGAGKTTLLRILLGLERPDSGSVPEGVRWSAVFQEDRLLEHLDAMGNLRFVLGAALDEPAADALLAELGLGWNLSLGGAITREVRGIPDDDSGTSVYQEKGYGCILNNSPTTGRPSMMGYAFYHELPTSTVFTNDILYSGKLGEEYVFARRAYVTGTNGSPAISPNCYELQPDIFHFSGPGIRGRFVLQPHGESLFYDTLDSPYGYSVSFEMNGDGFTGFTITTPDRYVYTYSQLDLCTNDSQISGANDMLQTPGSWRLSSIEAPDGRYVSFAYGQTNWAQSSQYVKIEQNSMLVTWDAAAGDDIIEYGSTSGGTGSPWLFAAYHVFHRLLVPRHPPCALFCLIGSTSFGLACPTF